MAQSWLQLSVRARGDQEADIADALSELGALAVTTEAADAELWLEAGLPTAPEWSQVTVTGLFDPDIDSESALQDLGTRFTNTELTRSVLADQDWERVCLDQFTPFAVGDGLWVVPGWCTPPAQARHVLNLDPGLAFGTGSHATTALCLDWLSRAQLKDKRIVDFGCGSGILGIAALILGAAHATAIDIDPRAVTATRENAKRNGVADRMHVSLPDAVSVARADIVIANILAGTLVALRDDVLAFLKPGGQLLLSGILHHQVDEVASAYASIAPFESVRREDWMLLVSAG